jgi:superfamily II DNA or RNA helicase
MQLRPYQTEGFERICTALATHGVALNASSTGVGKTVVSCAAAAKLSLKLAVICPKSVIRAWKETAAAFGVEIVFVTNYEQIKLQKLPQGRWKIKNRQFEWDIPRDTVLVFDEVHHCKNKKSQNAKLLVAAKRQNVKTLMLSATPAESPMDMYAIGYALELHSGDSDYIHWQRANGVSKGRWGPIYRGGVEGMAKIHHEIFPEKGYRAVAADLPGFPSNQVETIAVEHQDAAKVQKSLDELAKKIANDVELPIVDRLRARQQVELLKVKSICEMADNDVVSKNSVAIFVNFHQTLYEIQEHFGEDKCAIYHGKMDTLEREQNLKAFQENKKHVIVLQIKAGGQSIDLHDLHGRPRVSYICPPESATELVQALGRINRSGALSPALQKIVFAADTLEERIRIRVDAKVDRVEGLIDGDLKLFEERELSDVLEA